MKIFVLPLLCISVYAQAQKKDSALLQSFKFRTPNYRAVLLSGNASGNFNNAQGGNSFYSFSLTPRLRATKLVSTDKEYSTYDYEFSTAAEHSKSNSGTSIQRITDVLSTLKQSAQTKKYQGQHYFLTGYSSLLRLFSNSNTNDYNKKRQGLSASVTYTIGTGKGRIENVTDAQMAFNILSELKKNNLLVTDFTVEDAYGLAKTITQISNTRLFDFRRKRIFELKQIDSFLHTKGLIKDNSIDYFTTITDNWFYAFNQLRKHGKEKYITLTPVLGTSERKTIFKSVADSTQKDISKSAGTFLTLGLEKATARNIKKQFTRGINLQTFYSYGQTKIIVNTNEYKSNGSNIVSYLNGFLQWGYYPTTRTNINTTLSTSFVWQYSALEFANNTSLNFNGNYFINYNTRFFVNVAANIAVAKNSINNYRTTLSSTFNVGLQHFIR